MSSAPLVGIGWNGYITDDNGEIVANATITVRDSVTGLYLTGLLDLNNIAIGNPFTAGSDGYAAFRISKTGPNWANITATKGAFSASFDRVPLGDCQGYNIGNTNQQHLMVRNDIQLEFKAKTFDNLTAATDPTVNDDSDDGYVVDSSWVNTASSPMEAFVCLDATVGAAVWVNTTLTIGDLGTMALLDTGTAGSQFRTNTENETFFSESLTNNLVAGADPTATNDSGEGYSVLSVWINQASSPAEIFQCTDNTLTAAVWRNITADIDTLGTIAIYDQGTDDSEIQTNIQNATTYQPITVERTVDPGVGDDSDDGFIIGSQWVNTTSSPAGVFVAADVTVGAAVWNQFVGSDDSIKAWINFEGTGGVNIRDSQNVTSVTDNGTGDYTINFTVAMTDTDYTEVYGTGIYQADLLRAGVFVGVPDSLSGTYKTTSSIRIKAFVASKSTSNAIQVDYKTISAHFRSST